jgi:hypothetical protein
VRGELAIATQLVLPLPLSKAIEAVERGVEPRVRVKAYLQSLSGLSGLLSYVPMDDKLKFLFEWILFLLSENKRLEAEVKELRSELDEIYS